MGGRADGGVWAGDGKVGVRLGGGRCGECKLEAGDPQVDRRMVIRVERFPSPQGLEDLPKSPKTLVFFGILETFGNICNYVEILSELRCTK